MSIIEMAVYLRYMVVEPKRHGTQQIKGIYRFLSRLVLFNWWMWFSHRYCKGDPRPRIPPRVMTSSAVGLKLRVFRFLPTTHAEANVNKMRPRPSRAVRWFTGVYLHAQIAMHTHLTNHGLFDLQENPEFPQFEPRGKNGTGSGISLVYLWVLCMYLWSDWWV